MLNEKVIIFISLLYITIFANDAFALNPGDSFTFGDTVSPVYEPSPPEPILADSSLIWNHALDNIDNFDPDLDGTEPLIIESANLSLTGLTFKTTTSDSPYVFYALISLDDLLMSADTIEFSYEKKGEKSEVWSTDIITDYALDAIADDPEHIYIKITVLQGKLISVNSSTLSGEGHVAPEPISMVLVGVGIVGLPVAGRFRKFIEKG
jgi:hypothetical protein